MEKFDKRVVQAFIDGRPNGADSKQHRLAEEAYVHVGYDEAEAMELLRRAVPKMPSADVSIAVKTAVPIWDSLSSALSRTTSMAETLNKVNAALVDVGQPNAMTILGLYILARDSALREAAIRQAIPNVMRSSRAAAKRHGTPELQEQLAQALRAIWAKGKYRTRSDCAHHEYTKLGMTQTAAEAALRGTPDPNPWPAKEKTHPRRAG